MSARRDAGLSLIEVLVAMSLLALIGVMVSGAVGFGSAAWQGASRQGGLVAEQRVVQTFLRRQIATARAVRVRTGARQPPVLFEGTERTLRMIAPIQANLAPPGDHLIGLALDRDGVLGLRMVPAGAAPPRLTDAAEVEPLADGVADVTLHYFGPDVEGTPRWQPRWQSRARLPDLVEIRLTWTDPGRPAWPPLVIALDAAGRP